MAYKQHESYEWVYNRDEGKCRFCGGRVINEMQINGAKTGICGYRKRCISCDKAHIYNKMEIQKRIIPKQEMKVIPFRIVEFEGEIKPGVDIPKCFDFMILGSKGILAPPYKIIIHIDELNTGEVIYTECSCDDCFWKRNENCKNFVRKDYKCKHIKKSERILIEYKELTEIAEITNNTQEMQGSKSIAGEPGVDVTSVPETYTKQEANK